MPLPDLPPVLQAYIVAVVREAVRPAVADALADALPEAIRRAAQPTYLAREEAARYLRVSLRTLDSLRARRRIASTKRGGRVVLAVADLDAYLAEGRVAPRALPAGAGR